MATIWNYNNYNAAREKMYREYLSKRAAIQANYITVRWGAYWDADIALVAVGCALIGSMLLPPAAGFIIGGLAGYTFMVEKKSQATLNQMSSKLAMLDNEYYNNVRKYSQGGRKRW